MFLGFIFFIDKKPASSIQIDEWWLLHRHWIPRFSKPT